MNETFTACSLNVSDPRYRERIARSLRAQREEPVMVLNTCQRLEMFGWGGRISVSDEVESQCVAEDKAIRHLARVAAGLESRIIGELEVMGQVRTAYKEFHQAFGRQDAKLDRIFQKAIALARKARRESGVDGNLTGLAALTARRIMESMPETAHVTIIGSGSIAQGVARYLGKRSSMPVRVSSRCPENAMRLAMEIGGFHSGLDELIPMLEDADVVVSATAAPHPLIYNHHIKAGSRKKLIIDLGEPPDCAEEVQAREDIQYVGLLDMEAHAHTNTRERQERARIAARIIENEPL